MRGTASRPPQLRRGFSIVELLLVVLIGSVLLAVATPLVGKATRSMRVKAAAEELVSSLQLARIRATKENASVKVERLSAQTYSIGGAVYRLHTDAEFGAASADSIRFMPFGMTTTGAQTFVINVGADSARVDVSAAGYAHRVY